FCARFNHHDGLFRSRDDQVQTRLAHLVVSRVDDVAAFDQSDAHAGDWVQERNVGQVERARRARDRDHVRVVVRIGGDHTGDDLGLVAVTVGEEWPAGTVNEAAGKNLFFIGPAFAPEVIAGNTTGGIVGFTVFDREREEINTFAGCRRTDSGYEQ